MISLILQLEFARISHERWLHNNFSDSVNLSSSARYLFLRQNNLCTQRQEINP